MTSGSETLSSPQDARVVVIRPRRRFSLNLDDLWEYRELLYFLVWRDVKVRYKQTAIGAAWAVLQPVLAMVVFTLIFGRVELFRPDDVPYPVFVYSGLLVWLYFSAAIGQSSTSVVGNSSLVTKVYFPRLIIPLAAVVAPLVDFVIAFGVLVALMGVYGIVPSWEVGVLPAFMLLTLLTGLGLGLWLSALNVRYRDVPHAIPFLTQLWMFATPIIYPVTLIPEGYRWLLALNPMTGVIEGFRWALVGAEAPGASVLGTSVAVAAVLTVSGLLYFRRVERGFADVI
jgi:lipopolysaccharide transport system permease protein